MGREEAVLLPGTLVEGTVLESFRWGLVIEVKNPPVEAYVDQIFVADGPTDEVASSWPKTGSVVTGIVHRYTESGQLRLTLRQSDLEWARERVPSPDFWRLRNGEM